MTDMRPICMKCNTRMKPEKNNVEIEYAYMTYQRGDIWKCPECGIQIIKGFGIPYRKDGVPPPR